VRAETNWCRADADGRTFAERGEFVGLQSGAFKNNGLGKDQQHLFPAIFPLPH
jgi:hypothetical protein